MVTKPKLNFDLDHKIEAIMHIGISRLQYAMLHVVRRHVVRRQNREFVHMFSFCVKIPIVNIKVQGQARSR